MNTPPRNRTPQPACGPEQVCGSGLLNNYYEGKRLTAESFRVEQNYLRERRWLLNRAVHGWGVVYGYPVAPGRTDNAVEAGQLTIGAGLALDRCGRELLQAETSIGIADLIFLDKNGQKVDQKDALDEANKLQKAAKAAESCWLLRVHYAEQDSAPVTVAGPCRCEHPDWDQTCETVRYSLQWVLCSECCRDFKCELTCDCGKGEGPHKAEDAKGDKPYERGACRCLCEHLTKLPVGAESCWARIGKPYAPAWVDVRNGVDLACVQLVKDYQGQWTFGENVEACGPRRLVKRNDLLFDLIRGCDLTRISEIGWKDWHRQIDPIPFDHFSDGLGPVGNHQSGYVTKKFWVEFSRPVRKDTLRPDCFAMTIMAAEPEGGWWQAFRVPIVAVEATRTPEGGGPKDHVLRATMIVDGAWVEDAVRGRRTVFQKGETRVEIEARGDFIVDCNGQTIDANAVGLSPGPTGNGTPGGTFLSTFRVAQAPVAPQQ